MKVRSVQTHITFEAELTKQRPDLGPIALKHKDRDEYIAMRDVFGLPGTSFQKYQILEATPEEIAQLQANGIMIVETDDPLSRKTND